ncbi:hypothetical protein V6N13_034855 [Hibiscus sabdariffa]
MLEGASPLSDRSASSRKSEEVITDEPHAGKLARVGDRSTSFFIALGLCLDLLRAKSEGLVPMGIPLGLIPRLMTKGESAWRKVKIEGSREKFPSGVFRRSEGIQCPTTDSSRNCVIGAEPGMAIKDQELTLVSQNEPNPDLRENRLRQRTWHKPMLQLRESLGIPKFRNEVTRLKGEERGYATNEPGGEGLYLLCLGTKEMNRGVRNHSLRDRSHPPENPMVGSYSYGYEKPGKVTASGKVPAGSSREGVTAKGLLDCRAFFNLNKIVDLDTCVGPANGGGVLLDGSSCSALTLFLPLGPFLSAKDKREI